MNECVVFEDTRRTTGTLALWVLGASAVGSVVPNLVLALLAGAAMMVVWGLDLTRGPGTGVYLVACACCVVTYWAILHVVTRAIHRFAEVPRVVWPALLVWPVMWIAVSVFADPRGVLEPASAVVGTAGVLLAWFTSGRSRAARGGRRHA